VGPAGGVADAAYRGYGPYPDERRYDFILDNCRRFLAGQPLRNLVETNHRRDEPTRAGG